MGRDKKTSIKDFEELLKIKESDLNYQFMIQAVVYARYSKLYRKAEKQAKDMKNVMNIKYSDLFLKYKSQDLKKKITDKMADMMVIIDEEYQECVRRHLQAEHKSNYLKDLAEAFRQKAQMLVSLGADKRADKKMVTTIKSPKKDDDF
jgi:hypothetical protein